MRILNLYETLYPEYFGGVEHRNSEVASALRRRGHEVTLAGFGGESSVREEDRERICLGAIRHLYGESGRRSTLQAVRFALHVARLDLAPYDVVETANFPYIHLPLLAARCALLGKPLLVMWYEFWGDYWPSYVPPARAPVYRAIERSCARLGTRVCALSELARHRLAVVRDPAGSERS